MLEIIANTEDYLLTNALGEVIVLTREDLEVLYQDCREELLYK